MASDGNGRDSSAYRCWPTTDARWPTTETNGHSRKSLPWQVQSGESLQRNFEWAARTNVREQEALEFASVAEEPKDPYPVSGAGPSIIRSLFHPVVTTVVNPHCAVVAAVLNLGKFNFECKLVCCLV
jgi:hypothetical protein